jgi:hypothetical protein
VRCGFNDVQQLLDEWKALIARSMMDVEVGPQPSTCGYAKRQSINNKTYTASHSTNMFAAARSLVMAKREFLEAKFHFWS